MHVVICCKIKEKQDIKCKSEWESAGKKKIRKNDGNNIVKSTEKKEIDWIRREWLDEKIRIK